MGQRSSIVIIIIVCKTFQKDKVLNYEMSTTECVSYFWNEKHSWTKTRQLDSNTLILTEQNSH